MFFRVEFLFFRVELELELGLFAILSFFLFGSTNTFATEDSQEDSVEVSSRGATNSPKPCSLGIVDNSSGDVATDDTDDTDDTDSDDDGDSDGDSDDDDDGDDDSDDLFALSTRTTGLQARQGPPPCADAQLLQFSKRGLFLINGSTPSKDVFVFLLELILH